MVRLNWKGQLLVYSLAGIGLASLLNKADLALSNFIEDNSSNEPHATETVQEDNLGTYCDSIQENDSVYTLAERFDTSDVFTIEDQMEMQGKDFDDIGELVCFILPKTRIGYEKNIVQFEDNPYDFSSFSESVQSWEDSILLWSENIDLPYIEEEEPYLIATIMQIESNGNKDAISNGDALGLFQVMPFHFETEEDPFDPETNAYTGLNVLRDALEHSQGNIPATLAGYNGGYWATEWYMGNITRDEYTDYAKRWIDNYYSTQNLSEDELNLLAGGKAQQVETYVNRGLSVYNNSH